MTEQFHLNEYNALRDEVLELIRQIAVLNRFLLVSVALAVAWLLNASGTLDALSSFIGAWIPYFVAQWFGAYRKDLSEAVARLNDYLLKIERAHASPGLGWQQNIRTQHAEGVYLFTRTKFIHRLVSIFTLLFAFYYAVRYSMKIDILALFT
jgi:hypothetical protein